MMGRLAAWAACVVTLAAAGGMCAAELTPGQKLAADALIQQLGAKEFAARQKAVERLIELGPDVVGAVRKTMAETNDNEVKTRCQMVLNGITEKYGVRTDAGAAAAKADAWGSGASKITIQTTTEGLDEILRKFSEQSGNAQILAPEDFEGGAVKFSVKEMNYWDALDALCRQTGCMYIPGDRARSRSARLILRKGLEDLGGNSGPVTVKLESTRRQTHFRRFRSYIPIGEDTHEDTTWRTKTCLFLRYSWEDRLKAVSAECTVTKVTSPGGKVLYSEEAPEASDDARRRRAPEDGNCYGPLHTDVWTGPEPLDATMLGTVEGTVRLAVATGPGKETRIDHVTDKGEKTATYGNVELSVKETSREEGKLVLEVRATRKGRRVNVPLEGDAAGSNLFLVDGRGTRLKPQEVVKEREIKPGPEATETAQHLLATFAGIGNAGGDWSLVISEPGKTETKDYPFKIENVPGP